MIGGLISSTLLTPGLVAALYSPLDAPGLFARLSGLRRGGPLVPLEELLDGALREPSEGELARTGGGG
ncbi:MAG TPA: hypothetical protein VGM69_15315 [Chloroflexota bacterium]|jgi:hypothetical protein